MPLSGVLGTKTPDAPAHDRRDPMTATHGDGLDIGSFTLNLKKVPLLTVLEAALDLVMPAVASKQIAITREFDRSIGDISADAAKLREVFSSVLSNAVKFTPHQGHIRVAVRRQLFGANVIIEDNGTGIRAELLPYVFDRFRQGDRLLESDRGGPGPGLWIVRTLVSQHRGTVWAESAGDGRGASFTIALPLEAEL